MSASGVNCQGRTEVCFSEYLGQTAWNDALLSCFHVCQTVVSDICDTTQPGPAWGGRGGGGNASQRLTEVRKASDFIQLTLQIHADQYTGLFLFIPHFVL